MTINSGQAGGTGGQGQAGGTGDQGNGDQGTQGQGLTFEAWVIGQDENVRTMLDGHTSGLRSALNSERDARKGLEKQLKEIALKAEKGSELEKQLNELAAQQASLEQRADFFEQGHSAGVTNLKLAYLVASSEGYIDTKGRVNWDGMKKNYPELFGQTTRPSGNAGSGTNQQPTGAKSMNDYIRAAAGRKTN